MIAYWLIGFLLAVAFLPMVGEAARGRFDPFNLKNAFIVYYVLQLGISGLVPLVTGEASIFGPTPIGSERDYYETALNLSLWGMIAFQCGYYVTTTHWGLPRSFLLRWRPRRLKVFVVLSLLAGFAALATILIALGVDDVVEFRNQWRSGDMKGIGPLTFAATTLPALALVIWAVYQGDRLRFNIRLLLIIAAALAPALVMGFRGLFMFPLLQLALVYHYNVRRLSTWRMLVFFAFCGVVFTAYGVWRTIPSDVDVDWDAAADVAYEQPELLTTLLSRSKGTEVVASVVKKLDETGEYQYGYESIIEAFTSWIPRAIWEDKPLSFGERFGTYFFGGDLARDRGDYARPVWGGVSPTAVGELYWHFSWPGVVLGLFLIGVAARLAYNTFRAHPGNRAMLVFYAILFVHFLGIAEAPTGYLDSLVIQALALVVILYSLNITVFGEARQGAATGISLPRSRP